MLVSYSGYVPIIKNFIQCIPQERPVSLLEIGIDRGTTLIPLVAYLARTRPQFIVVGLDVKVQEQVNIVLSHLDLQEGQQAFCIEGSSLDVLPKIISQNLKFDVVLIDGDHNYHTVSHELRMLEDLITPDAMVICDDYSGRWSERDLWYSERDGYQDVPGATKRVHTNKQGVKAAVDEWIASHPGWRAHQILIGEPVMLVREKR